MRNMNPLQFALASRECFISCHSAIRNGHHFANDLPYCFRARCYARCHTETTSDFLSDFGKMVVVKIPLFLSPVRSMC